MKTTELKIEGMSCGHCVMAVKKELSKLNGVEVDDVQIGSARVRRDENKVWVQELNRAVERAGYRVISVQEGRES
ncbi:MAG TPA: heavy-metal-associated domain-containing protein [Bacteroidota bacterium]|nr:heavy-metal-associated domain-containing protein [Bacteroidota bacterium]